MEVNAVFLSGQRELVCIGLSEFEAESLQPHPADLTVMTRHEDPFDEIVHLVPVVALGQRTSNSFRSDMEQGEMLLLDKPLSLFRRNNDPVDVSGRLRLPRVRLGIRMGLQVDAPRWGFPSRLVALSTWSEGREVEIPER
jgi:hypothetical protein